MVCFEGLQTKSHTSKLSSLRSFPNDVQCKIGISAKNSQKVAAVVHLPELQDAPNFYRPPRYSQMRHIQNFLTNMSANALVPAVCQSTERPVLVVGVYETNVWAFAFATEENHNGYIGVRRILLNADAPANAGAGINGISWETAGAAQLHKRIPMRLEANSRQYPLLRIVDISVSSNLLKILLKIRQMVESVENPNISQKLCNRHLPSPAWQKKREHRTRRCQIWGCSRNRHLSSPVWQKRRQHRTPRCQFWGCSRA